MIIQNEKLGRVIFTGEISNNTASELIYSIESVISAIKQSKELKDVTLVINSPGGGIYHAMMAYDYIKDINDNPDEPVKINTHGFGLIGSCAISLLSAGRNIKIAPSATIIHHMISNSSIMPTPLSYLEKNTTFLRKHNDIGRQHFFDMFDLPEEEINQKEESGMDQCWLGSELLPVLRPQPEPNPVRPNPDWVDPNTPKLPKNGIVLNGEVYETPLGEATFENTAARLEAIYQKSLTMIEK